MKVLHTGNLVNNSYKLAMFQRALGVDARLVLDGDQPGTKDDPVWEDPELAGGYPGWIEVSRAQKHKGLLRRIDSWVERIRSGRRYVRERGIDIVHAQVTSPIFAQFFGARVLFSHCLGSDLRELAQSRTLRGALLRRAYRSSSLVFFNNVDHLEYLDRLGIEGEFLPNPYNLDRIRPQKREVRFEGFNFVVLHPTNQDWTYRGKERLSTKGNDRLIRAFARFVGKKPGALLVMIRSGPDIAPTKVLLKELGIESNVVFRDRMRKEEFIRMLNSADLIADQFEVGAFGGVALEAMACGKPLVTYLKEDCARKCYPELPLIYNARTEEEIYEALLRAADDDLEVRGRRSREWVEAYHHGESVARRVVEKYASALEV